jgi:hypothetical protein
MKSQGGDDEMRLAAAAFVSIMAMVGCSGPGTSPSVIRTPPPAHGHCPRAGDVLGRLLEAFDMGDVDGVTSSLTDSAQVVDDIRGALFNSLDHGNGSAAKYMSERMATGERFADITITAGISPDVAGLVMTRTLATNKLYVHGKAVTSLVYPDCVAISALIMTSKATPTFSASP